MVMARKAATPMKTIFSPPSLYIPLSISISLSLSLYPSLYMIPLFVPVLQAARNGDAQEGGQPDEDDL